MTTLVSAELHRLRTVRAPWLTAAVLLAVAVAVLGFTAALLGDPGQPAAEPAVLGDLVRVLPQQVGGAALLIGLLAATGEYRHRGVLTTRLAEPRVTRVLTARAAAAALAGAALAVAVQVVLLAGGAVVLAGHGAAVEPLRHGVPAAMVTVPAVAALLAVAGVAVGELLRSPAQAVGAVLGWAFVVEGVLPVVLREPGLVRWLPTGAVKAAVAAGTSTGSGLLAPAAGAALLVAFVAVLAAAGTTRAWLQDP